MEHPCNQNYNFETRSVIEDICLVLEEYYESQWFQKVNQERAISGQDRNKLRTYRQLYTEFKAEEYLIKVMNRKHHSSLAKFRAGVDPIRLETGQYEGLEVNDRICPICKNGIETEEHVITRCPSYRVPRDILYNACTQLCDDFNSFTYIKKLCFIISNPDICILSAKTCHIILQQRRTLLYTK